MEKEIKKQIVSVSRRTDIPAFYAEWFINRVREGYCVVVNPFNANQLSYVSLKPGDVIAFVFWTRNPRPLFKYLPELDKGKYKYYFQYTIIGYPKEIEPYSPVIDSAVKTFRELSGLIGKDKIIWRYDPILLSNITPVQWHINRITFLMKALAGYTRRLVISFIDPYRKTKLRLDGETSSAFKLLAETFDARAYRGIAEFIAGEAKKHGLAVQTCAEEIDLIEYGINHGKCVDGKVINRMNRSAVFFQKDRFQRKLCGCAASKDIGANNTCLFGCKYCYAVSSLKLARNNFKKHNKQSASLMGAVEP